jgi:hypothetical protein
MKIKALTARQNSFPYRIDDGTFSEIVAGHLFSEIKLDIVELFSSSAGSGFCNLNLSICNKN